MRFSIRGAPGPLKGHITRVKLIKRAGYGRAKLPLLRARIRSKPSSRHSVRVG